MVSCACILCACVIHDEGNKHTVDVLDERLFAITHLIRCISYIILPLWLIQKAVILVVNPLPN